MSAIKVLLALVAVSATAVAGQSCSTPSGSGVCRTTSTCPDAGGTSVPNYCPGATNYQCCVFKSCSTPSGSGKCRPTSECTGTKVPGYCPGPATTQCCVTGGSSGCGSLSNPYSPAPKGSGGWNPITQFVVNKINACFPGKFSCSTYIGSSTSDHPGNGADCFPGPAGTCASGSDLADGTALRNWAVANHVALKINYVIWQNLIWSRSNPTWRSQGKTGCTYAHYDHVHISVITP